MPSSSRHQLKALIVSALNEADEIDVPVTVGREPERSSAYIWLWPKLVAERDFHVIGRQPPDLEERPKVKLRVVAIANDPAIAEERCLAIADSIEAVLRPVKPSAPFLGSLLIAEVDDEPQDFDRKAGHSAWITVTAKARI